MKRRDFMRNAALLGTTVGLVRASGAWSIAPMVVEERRRSLAFQQDESDRSLSRDPMAIQRSTLVVSGLDVSTLNERYLGMLKAGGVNCWHKSMGGTQSFADVYNFLDQHSDTIIPVTTVREIRQAYQQGKIGLVFGWQSAEVLESKQSNAEVYSRTALRAYYELGLRIVGIAYNLVNDFGAGCLHRYVGLTRAGRRLVEEIHNLRIVLDVGGHTGEQTSLDAIAMSKGVPVICSHANAAGIVDNPRNISDRLIEAIAKTGGVVGILATNDYHARSRKDAHIPRSPQASLKAHLDHYDYVRKLVGVDHVGIGPDFIEGRAIDYEAVTRANTFPREVKSDGPWILVKGFENITELPNVIRGLIKRGWSAGEIRKVLGENWLRVYKQVWGV